MYALRRLREQRFRRGQHARRAHGRVPVVARPLVEPIRDPRDTPTPNYLTFSLGPFAMHSHAPDTRFEAMLFGAGSAGTLAMFVGAIGNTLGAFDEDTTWILTGAAAAVGAIYSGSRYQVRATLYPEPWSIPSGPPRSP